MKPDKTAIWEKEFSDNFQPSFFIRLIKKIETYRGDVIAKMVPSSETVVDLACGDGDLLLKVANKCQKLVGFDIARNRIENAAQKIKDNTDKQWQFKVHDLDQGIPLEDESVDVLVCEASLAYLYNLNFILEEVHRVLKKKGIFIVQVPNYAYFFRRLDLLRGKLPRTSSFPGLDDGGALHYFTYQSLKQRLADHKMKVTEEQNSGLLAGLRRVMPSLLASDIIYKAQKNG